LSVGNAQQVFTPETNSQTAPLRSEALASDQQALELISKAQTALTNGAQIKDMTLRGMAILAVPRSADADVVIKTRGSRQSSISYSDGIRRLETRNDKKVPAGQWMDSMNVLHRTAFHNSLIPAGILNPIALLDGVVQPSSTLTYVGLETFEGNEVLHLRYFHRPPKNRSHMVEFIQGLSTLDLFLDSNSLHVNAVKFNLHPENNALENIPAELRFEDYRPVENSILVPFHISRFINGNLDMNLRISSVQVDSGLSETEFALQ